MKEISKPTSDGYLARAESVTPRTVKRMLRILLRDPRDDYEYISRLGKDTIAIRKALYFKLVSIRQCYSASIIEQSRLLSSIQSANIATIYDLYYNDNKVFVIAEHLDISLS